MLKLLTRDAFRESVFSRDMHLCVFCQLPAVDAHHIMERRLFTSQNEFGGYFLDNGVSVCETHHRLCESTDISTDQARQAANIKKVVLPEHLYDDQVYTKWGDVCLPNGRRLRGELFFDQSVQKILKNHLDSYSHIVKYPRTHHVPWSENMSSDDRQHSSMSQFDNKRVIVTTKMDGENSTLYSNYFHARSVDGRHHPSRDWVKQFWSGVAQDIPSEWRICGENMFAKHSIHYENLETYFYGFSIWNESNVCLSWDDTLEWFDLLNIKHVPVIYDDVYDEKEIRSLWDKSLSEANEGYVIRIVDSFSYADFKKYVGKFVRKNWMAGVIHHWQYQQITKNKLKGIV